MEVAATVGAKPMDAFFNVVLPLAKPGFVTAALLTFAHTIGEFGAVLMIGGNVPEKHRWFRRKFTAMSKQWNTEAHLGLPAEWLS